MKHVDIGKEKKDRHAIMGVCCSLSMQLEVIDAAFLISLKLVISSMITEH